MTMITPSYLGETIEYSSLHACRSTLEDPTVYLVLFSYALFNEGSSGLTITIGAIVTLFAIMQLTGRIRWSEHLAEGAVTYS